MSTIILGATIRPQALPSAVVVAQLDWAYNIRSRKRQDLYQVRYMELIAARTPYPDIAARLAQIVENLHTQNAQFKSRILMYVEVTGLGPPIVDLIKARADPIITCYMSRNDRRVEHDGRVTIGKAWMIARLQTLFQGARISIPQTKATLVLVDELLSFSVDPSPQDNELTGSFILGTQDELLTALGLACQGLPEGELDAEEFLEYMRRRAMGMPTTRGPSPDWLQEWHGKSPVQALDPITLRPLDPHLQEAAGASLQPPSERLS